MYAGFCFMMISYYFKRLKCFALQLNYLFYIDSPLPVILLILTEVFGFVTNINATQGQHQGKYNSKQVLHV